MGATGSYFEKWTASDTVLQENQDGILQKVNNTVSEMLPRLDTVEKRATNMLFQQQEMDCDLVIIH